MSIPSVLATLRQHAILIVNVQDHGREFNRFPFLFLVEMLTLCSKTGSFLGLNLTISSTSVGQTLNIMGS